MSPWRTESKRDFELEWVARSFMMSMVKPTLRPLGSREHWTESLEEEVSELAPSPNEILTLMLTAVKMVGRSYDDLFEEGYYRAKEWDEEASD